jgi:hypothetical protein
MVSAWSAPPFSALDRVCCVCPTHATHEISSLETLLIFCFGLFSIWNANISAGICVAFQQCNIVCHQNLLPHDLFKIKPSVEILYASININMLNVVFNKESTKYRSDMETDYVPLVTSALRREPELYVFTACTLYKCSHIPFHSHCSAHCPKPEHI